MPLTAFLLILLCSALTGEQNALKGPFILSRPDHYIGMPNELVEISGLTWHQDAIYAVQDEKGHVFTIQAEAPHDIKDRKFWKKGDFEGVEYADGHLYMIKSNGKLYVSDLDDIDEEKTRKFELEFEGPQNIEGLGYDPYTKRLIIADKGEELQTDKGIYAISPDSLDAKPRRVYTIDEKAYMDFFAEKKDTWLKRFAARFSLVNYTFRPSGIAIDPHTGEYYILSSPNPQILILTRDWQIRDIIFLSERVHRQPEGICFDDNGNLYISNEGRATHANILKFERHE